MQVAAQPCKCPPLAACDEPPSVKQHAGLSAINFQSLAVCPLCQSPGRAKVCSACSMNHAACAACAVCTVQCAQRAACATCSRDGALCPAMGGRAPPGSRSIPVPLHKNGTRPLRPVHGTRGHARPQPWPGLRKFSAVLRSRRGRCNWRLIASTTRSAPRGTLKAPVNGYLT